LWENKCLKTNARGLKIHFPPLPHRLKAEKIRKYENMVSLVEVGKWQPLKILVDLHQERRKSFDVMSMYCSGSGAKRA